METGTRTERDGFLKTIYFGHFQRFCINRFYEPHKTRYLYSYSPFENRIGKHKIKDHFLYMYTPNLPLIIIYEAIMRYNLF